MQVSKTFLVAKTTYQQTRIRVQQTASQAQATHIQKNTVLFVKNAAKKKVTVHICSK